MSIKESAVISKTSSMTFFQKVNKEFHCTVNRYAVSMILMIGVIFIAAFHVSNPSIFYPLLVTPIILSTLFTLCFFKKTTRAGGHYVNYI